MTIPTLDPPLASDDVATFNSKAFDFVSDLVTWTTEVNSAGTTIATNASTASTAATTASSASSAAAAAANYVGLWSSLSGALAIPASVVHDSRVWMLTENVADVTVQTPGVSTKWIQIEGPRQVLHAQDQKTSGTNGQSISTTTWTKRELQTAVTNTITGASITSHVIALPAGTYKISVQASGVYVAGSAGHQRLRLRNTSDGSTTLAGVNMSVIGTNTIAPVLTLQGQFTITATKNFEVQHYVTTTGNVTGAAMSSGEVEVYADVYIERVS